MLSHAPRFDAQAAARLARDLYGLSGTVRSLTSERDQNFLLETSAGERLVLKIANALEDPAMLDAQQRAMTHVGSTALDLAPRVIPTRQGSTLHTVDGHLVWAVSHRPGIPLGLIRHRSRYTLLEALGAEIGALTRPRFAGSIIPALHQDFYWDLARGRSLVALYPAVTRRPDARRHRRRADGSLRS